MSDRAGGVAAPSPRTAGDARAAHLGGAKAGTDKTRGHAVAVAISASHTTLTPYSYLSLASRAQSGGSAHPSLTCMNALKPAASPQVRLVPLTSATPSKPRFQNIMPRGRSAGASAPHAAATAWSG